MTHCRWRPARWPASRKPKLPALAMPTPPRSRSDGRSETPQNRIRCSFQTHHRKQKVHAMIDKKNRYGRTAARIHDADGLARGPSSVALGIHAHIVIPQAAKLAQPHVDLSRIPLAHFADAATREINAQQEKDIAEALTTIERRLCDLDRRGIDIQVVPPAPGQCYYSIDPKIAEAAHRIANEGVSQYVAREPDQFGA